MSDPFIGEVQIYAFPFAPRNWAFAAGQLVPLRQSTALYALYGTIFGGDGSTTFGLPNLAGRQACGQGQGPGTQRRNLGDTFGEYSVALNTSELPMHNHTFLDYIPSLPADYTAAPTASSGIGSTYGGVFNVYGELGTPAIMDPNAIGMSGSGAAHMNGQPFLGLNYSVAMAGAYPSFG